MIHVFVLLGGLFGLDGWADSRGMVTLADRIGKIPNVKVVTYGWSSYQTVIEDIKKISTKDKIVLVGYSGGGSRITWIANMVKKPIELLIAYDPSPAFQTLHLPDRVKKAVCYYNTSPMMLGLGGGRLTGKHVETIRVSEQHLSVQSDESLHKITIARIKELCL